MEARELETQAKGKSLYDDPSSPEAQEKKSVTGQALRYLEEQLDWDDFQEELEKHRPIVEKRVILTPETQQQYEEKWKQQCYDQMMNESCYSLGCLYSGKLRVSQNRLVPIDAAVMSLEADMLEEADFLKKRDEIEQRGKEAFKQACELGNPTACFEYWNLDTKPIQERGQEPTAEEIRTYPLLQKTLDFYMERCNQDNDGFSCAQAYEMLHTAGDQRAEFYSSRATHFLNDACENKNDGEACFMLTLTASTRGKADQLTDRACALGNAKGCFARGLRMQNDYNYVEAEKAYRDSCFNSRGGEEGACWNLGLGILSGQFKPTKNDDDLVEIFWRSCQLGEFQSCFLARGYSRGFGWPEIEGSSSKYAQRAQEETNLLQEADSDELDDVSQYYEELDRLQDDEDYVLPVSAPVRRFDAKLWEEEINEEEYLAELEERERIAQEEERKKKQKQERRSINGNTDDEDDEDEDEDFPVFTNTINKFEEDELEEDLDEDGYWDEEEDDEDEDDELNDSGLYDAPRGRRSTDYDDDDKF